MVKNIVKIMCALAVLALAVPPALVYAGKMKPPTNAKGKPPRTTLVELPQDSLKVLAKGGTKRTLVILGESPGVVGLPEGLTAGVARLIKEGKWDGLLAVGYPSPYRHPVTPVNFVSFAHSAGYVDKVYWVPPIKEGVGKEPLDEFKEFLKGLGIPQPELDALKQTKDSIEGSLAGIPYHICSLKELPKIKGEVFLVADLTFFTQVYENEVKTPFLDLIGGMMEALGRSGLKVSDAVVSYSTLDRGSPIDMRFAGRYLHTCLTQPSKVKKGPPRTWTLRSEAMYYETFFQTDDAHERLVEAVRLDPKDPSLAYSLALACLGVKDLECVRNELDRAVRLDRGYYLEYVAMTEYFIGKDMAEDALYFARQAVKTAPEDPRAQDALYDAQMAMEDYDGAAGAAEKQVEMGFKNPKMLELLAEAYHKGKRYEKAEAVYKEALSLIPPVDKKSGAGLAAKLAGVYEAQGRIEEAIAMYADAFAWTDDEALKQEIAHKVDELGRKWEPFLYPSE